VGLQGHVRVGLAGLRAEDDLALPEVRCRAAQQSADDRALFPLAISRFECAPFNPLERPFVVDRCFFRGRTGRGDFC